MAAGLETEVPGMLWHVREVFVLLGALVVFLAAIELGFRLGLRQRDRSDDAAKSQLGALQAGLLGLLALLLGFTFNMAVSRFDVRKTLVLDEANAIGTTYLRARFLPPPHQQEAARLLKEYVAARLDFYRAGIDADRLAAASASAARIQQQLWTHAAMSAAQDPRSVPIGLFIQSLNDVIDLSEKHQVALDDHVPGAVMYLLFIVAAGALGFIAYGSGLAGRRRHGLTGAFALMVAIVLAIIIDLDRPRRGLILVSQASMVRLQAALDQSTE